MSDAGALSEANLKYHEVPEFEMFVSNLERYFEYYDELSNTNQNQVIILDYPSMSMDSPPMVQHESTPHDFITYNGEESSITVKGNKWIPNSHIVDKFKVIQKRISSQECGNAFEISPLQSFPKTFTRSSSTDTAALGSDIPKVTYTNQETCKNNDNMKPCSKKYSLGFKNPLNGKASLQSILRLPFNLQNDPLPDETSEIMKEPFEKLVEKGCQILNTPLSLDELRQEFSKSMNIDDNLNCQIPLTVIEVAIDNLNYLSKRSLWESEIRQDIRHFVHIHCTSNPSHPTESREYWRQCKHDLNFDPPDTLYAIKATKSQNRQYQRLISNIRKKRKILQTSCEGRLEEYRK